MAEELIDRHGRVAAHPDEFRGDLDELDAFDGEIALGYLRRLEVLLDACPIDIYAASSLKHPWPYRLQNAAECYPASFWRSPHRLMDSAITAPELSNRDVLEHALERHATAVAAKDFLPFEEYERLYENGELSEAQIDVVRSLQRHHGDHRQATTDSVREFVDVYDPELHPPAYIPVQPPYPDHLESVYPIIEESNLDHRYMLGGLAEEPPARRIAGARAFRTAVGYQPTAHGLGWGLEDDLLAAVRDDPRLIDSVDNSSPAQAVQNDQILNKHWQSTDCAHVDGQYQNAVGGAFEFAMLVQATHRLTEFNDDVACLADQSNLSEFGGHRPDG